MNLKWLGAFISNARKEGFLEADFQFIDCDASCIKEGLDKRILNGAFFPGAVRHFDQSCFQYVSLFRESIHAVIAPDHKLARAGILSVCDLLDEPVVWLRRDVDPILHDTLTDLCAVHGYRPNVVQETGALYECLHFAREGVGITFLPSFMSALAHEGAVFVDLAGAFHVDYTMVYRRQGSNGRPVDRFVKFVQDYVAKKA